MFEAAIFDWDGTLADTRGVIVVSFQRVLSENGLDVPIGYIERRIGIGASDTFREILRLKGRRADEALVTRLVRQKSEVQVELASEVQLFDGAKELLETLRGKVKVALASMNSNVVVSHLLKINHLEECFEVVLTADCVGRSKPDPEIFLKAAAKLKTSPARCVVFEDSIFGVKAAKAGSMSCIAVATGIYSNDELEAEKPDLLVKNLKDPKIISFVLH
ncbi:MAG: HAD family phosphatase [Nitrososphaerota archaeon]|jgi:beta-phosphoglucomutase|nr:HAD family phosphatase [Nitrososphaerota archaeon]